MSERLELADGTYTVPTIGPRLMFEQYPEASFFVSGGRLGLHSVLQATKIYVDEVFADPRAATFVDTIVRHQFHHLDTRQLSLPERFEFRDGAGRMDRLTTLVESAIIIAKLNGTLEQVAQVMMSDINVTVDSHRLGDHLEGDYETESTRDDDIVDYAQRSGLHDALVRSGVIDMDGRLAGSSTNLFDLANPNTPRRYDIAECPRPDQNADRTPFTLIEGLYLTRHSDIIDAVKAIIRVEVGAKSGQTEERMAFNDRDAARLLYQLSVRHATEHWGDVNQKTILELISLADKYRFSNGTNEFHPIDYARTAEHVWYETNDQNTFISGLYAVAQQLAYQFKKDMMPVQQGSELYSGPVASKGMEIVFSQHKLAPGISVERLNRRFGQLVVNLPEHKRRAPIDSLVATSRGLKRITEEDPTLASYAARQMQWLGSAVAKLTLPWEQLAPLKAGIEMVDRQWHGLAPEARPEPLRRPHMPKSVLSRQISDARQKVAARAHNPIT